MIGSTSGGKASVVTRQNVHWEQHTKIKHCTDGGEAHSNAKGITMPFTVCVIDLCHAVTASAMSYMGRA
jgi:hypothetical protein